MTPDNQKKYEEAAKEHYPDVRLNSWEGARAGFVAGASFAEKEKTLEYKLAIETAAILKEQRDEALDKLEALEKEIKRSEVR